MAPGLLRGAVMLTALLLSLSLAQVPTIVDAPRSATLLERDVAKLERRIAKLEQPLPTERVLVSGLGLGALSTGLGLFFAATYVASLSPALAVLTVMMIVSGPLVMVGAVVLGIVFAVQNAKREQVDPTAALRAELAQKRVELEQARTPVTVFTF